MVKLEQVFGVIDDKLLTYVSRQNMDDCFKKAFIQKKQLVIYGSSKQGKTTLIKNNIKCDDGIKVQCSPTMDLSNIYKTILKNLEITIQNNTSHENYDNTKTTFSFKAILPLLVESKIGITKTTGKNKKNSDLKIDIDGAQDIAELIKTHFPEKIIILENFHYLTDEIQKSFAFDLRTFQDIGTRVIISGMWRDENRLNQYNGDLQDRIIELPVEPWLEKDLRKIIKLGEQNLNIDMSNIEDDLIMESWGNVGILQELCSACCHDANISENGELKKLTNENLKHAIGSIINSCATRYFNTLVDFINPKSAQLKNESHKLGIPYLFVRVILSDFAIREIKNGLSAYDLKTKMKSIHPNASNTKFDDVLTDFLNMVNIHQKNSSISPPIFYYNSKSQKMIISDQNFFFFIKHKNNGELLSKLRIPQVLKKQNAHI